MRKKDCVTQTRRKKSYDGLVTFILISDTPGYRMKSYGPSSLLQIDKKNKLIDIQITSILKVFSNIEIILCVGFEAEKISKYIRQKHPSINLRIVENQLFNETNSCEALRLSLNNVTNDKIFLVDGNLLFNYKTLAKNDFNSSYIYIESKNNNLEVGANVNEDICVEYFSFGASKCWSEIMFLSDKRTIDYLRKVIGSENYRKKFIFEALNELIKAKFKITTIENSHSVKKINNIKIYHELKANKK